MANVGNVVGKVAVLEGQAFARGADGKMRALKLGDVVYEGEVIVTATNSHVELAFEGGKTYLVREQETVTLDKTVFGTDLPDSRDAALLDSAKTTDDIARAIAEGGSLDELLEETALTLAGGAADDGHGFVELMRIVETVPPAGYDYGTDGVNPTAELVGGSALNNAPPEAVDDTVTTDEDTPINIAVRGNDSDPESDVLTVSAVTDGAHGTVAIDPVSGNPVYTPNRNWNGTDTFTYTIDDGHGGTATATVTVTVNAVNDTPVAGTIDVTPDGTTTADPNSVGAGNYLHTIPEDTSASGQVQATDVDGDVLVYSQASNPAHGSVVVNPDGSYTYTPNANYNGNDSFTVLVSDGHGGTTTSTVSIVITPVQDASIITPGSGSVTEDAVLSTSGRLTITDVDGPQDERFTPQSNVAGAHGTFSIDVNGNWTYNLNNGDPAVQALNAGQSMTEVFNVTGVDGTPSTVTVVINGVNENAAPGAQNDAATTVQDVPVTINVLGNDADPDGDPLSISGFGQGANGTVTLVAGQLVYTPSSGFVGTDTFTYSVNDGKGGTDSATVTIAVGVGIPVNQPPVANADTATTAASTPVTIAVLANDTDPENDSLVVTAASVPAAQGTVVVNGDNTVTFTPAAGFTGNATISYTISDGTGTSNSTVTVGVAAPVNQPPVANPDTATTGAVTPVTIAVLANDTDPEGDTLSVTAASVPAAHGTVVVNGDNTVTFTPAAGFTGNATISYTISDGTGTSNSTVTVGVAAPVNQAPDAINDGPLAATEDTALTITPVTLLGNDTDPDGNPLTITSVQGAVNGTVALVGGNVVFTPAPGYNGQASFTYTISDGQGGSDTATVTLNVGAVNDAPTATGGTASGGEDVPLVFNWAQFNIADVDTPVASLNLRVTSLPADGTLQYFNTGTSSWTAVTLNQVISKADIDAGRFRLVPDLNESGVDGYPATGTGNLHQDYASFNYQAYDGAASSAVSTMRVDIAPAADMPTLTVTNTTAAVVFNTSWETVANTNNTSSNAGTGPIEGWTLLTTPEGQGGGTHGFEIWTEGDTQQRQDGGYNAVFAATGNGVNWLELNDSAGSLVQTIGISRSVATQAGMVYEVSFDYAGRPGFTTAYTTIAIQVDGVTVASYASTSPQTSLDWKNLKFSLAGDGAAHTITLLTTPTAYNSGGRGAMIDDITLTGYQGVTAGNAAGGVATDINLYRYVTAALIDADTSEALTVTFASLPAGAQIITASHTYSEAGGSITVPGSELGTAVLRIGSAFTGDLHLGVTATAAESTGGSVATTAVQVLDIHVAAPVGTLQAVDIADPWSSLTLAGTSSADTVSGGPGNDTISGLAGDDTLVGNAGSDILVGGQGNDALTGGSGSDTFRWSLGDGGSTASVARDTISDFDPAAASVGGDVLDLRDLLSPTGGTASGLDNFLHFQYSGGDTTIYVSATGAFNNNNAVGTPPTNVSSNDVQQIVVQGVNLIGASTTDQQVIQNLLNANKLLVD